MRPGWLLTLLPLALGALAAALLGASLASVPIVYLRADLAVLAVLLGLACSLAVVGARSFLQRIARTREETAVETSSRAADDRRRFIGRLDHELKNPLTAIRVGLANLAEAPVDAARGDALASIAAQTVRLSRLSADLRKLADLETRPLERDVVDVAEVLQDVVSLARERPETAERRLALTIPRAPWPLPAVAGDHDLLFLAFHNLLDNALKFTRPGDTVELRAFEDGAVVVVEVADTGAGIAESDVPHVWEELYRGQGARETPGSGLGLALVRAVVARHGGTTALRSRSGQGTVVIVRLPAGA